MHQETTHQEIAKFIVDTLNLPNTTEDIKADTILFGEQGLQLDSIDALEIAFAITKQYGFHLHANDPNNKTILSSLATLTEHIAQHRTQ
ncbi:MAG: acyl carrier protein [Gammaproteobacteria bacterium]|nr:acyl carrier protein [Gammaproteobacteria bacterium]